MSNAPSGAAAQRGNAALRAMIAIIGVALLATLVYALSRPPSRAANAQDPSANSVAAADTIKVDTNDLGAPLTGRQAGFSFEAATVARPSFGTGNLAQYLKTVGPSVLRIGGASADLTFWTATGEEAPTWARATMRPAALRRLATIASATGWKVVLAVNFRHFNPARAADEALHARQLLGRSLQAIEIGNEPNGYYTDTAEYFADFDAYVTAIHASVPDAVIVGPDTDTGKFQNAFVADQTRRAHRSIGALTQHFYPLYGCRQESHSIGELLGQPVHDAELNAAKELAANASRLKVPAIFDEVNSVACGGQNGLSNVFASALWVLDLQMIMASAGISGSYLHGMNELCSQSAWYTPLCANSAADAATGDLVAQPEYYGVAAFRLVGEGQFARVTNPTSVRAYAVVNSGTLSVVLINMADPATAKATDLRLALGRSYSSVRRVDLTAPNLDDKTGITLGGAQVTRAGTLAAPAWETLSAAGPVVAATVRPGSAAILSFH